MDSPMGMFSTLALSVIISLVGVFVFNNDQSQFLSPPTSSKSQSDDKSHMRLILISMDGFRWDHLNGRAQTPNFDALKRRGVHARRGMQATFISNTLPNHFTLVTGLYPDSHGMLDNTLYDPQLDSLYVPIFYDHDRQNDPRFYAGLEPIWVSNALQRKSSRSGSDGGRSGGGRSGLLLWMAGDAPMKGVLPHRYVPHSYDMPEMAEMRQLVEWVSDDVEPVDLALVYFPEPDSLSHVHGPDSPEVTAKIEELDEALGFLIRSLDETGLASETNVIVLADHGFTTISREKTIDLDRLLDKEWCDVYTIMPAANIFVFPRAGYLDVVFDKLKTAADTTGHFKVYKTENIPERFHLRNHKRLPPIVAMAVMNYSFVSGNMASRPDFYKGNHGYDNQESLMHPIFLAYGPSFKQGVAFDDFTNLDVYPLMCHLLGIEPQPHNGSLAASASILRDGDLKFPPSWPDLLLQFAMFQTVVILLLMAVNVVVGWSRSHNRSHSD